MASENSDDTEEILFVASSEMDFLRETASAKGVVLHEPSSRSIEPLVTIAVVLVGSSAMIASVIKILDEYRGGQVIDMRRGARRRIYRTRDVKFGLVVVLRDNEDVTLYKNDLDGKLDALKESLSTIGLNKLNDVVESAKNAVPPTQGESDPR